VWGGSKYTLAKAYLSLGSNLGDRLRFLKEAISKIEESDNITINRISSVYETQPVGYKNQGWFLNLVIEIETSLVPQDLLQHILTVEDQMGRKREVKWGPRNIDIDILLYDNQVIQSNHLTVPHPRMPERRFVLLPLAEIAPKLLHPQLIKSIEELLEGCEDKSKVWLTSEKL
jgi:2-amino-4-hydroxy-6-hydroxymethyldihydropteridine diphosphokinase